MHKVRKKSGKLIKAWQLGQNSDMEKRLLAEKKITYKDGIYRLMSLEAVRGGCLGEVATTGDWFRIEERTGQAYPYPLNSDYFRANFRKLKGTDDFEAIPKILDAWFAEEPISQELCYLLDVGKLILTDDNIIGLIWGTTLSAPKKGSAVIFYSVSRLPSGEISAVDFNLIDAQAFQRDYEVLS